jgi:hypothetical protein
VRVHGKGKEQGKKRQRGEKEKENSYLGLYDIHSGLHRT